MNSGQVGSDAVVPLVGVAEPTELAEMIEIPMIALAT